MVYARTGGFFVLLPGGIDPLACPTQYDHHARHNKSFKAIKMCEFELRRRGNFM